MVSRTIDQDTIRAAADAVTEFGTVAFQEEFLRWDKDVNLGVASLVWNYVTCNRGVPGGFDIPVVPGLRGLRDRLLDVRLKRWPDADYMVMAWQARVEGGEIVFSFDLWWDAAQYCQPCEMTWVMAIADSTHTN